VDDYLTSLAAFLAILNPFALCLYLAGVMDDLSGRDFQGVLARASLVSFLVFAFCALMGEPILVNLLGVRPEAMRVFGGAIFLILAYGYVMRGYRETALLRGSLEDLPSEIAVPFMIGAGTITQAILIGKRHTPAASLLLLAAGMVVAVGMVFAFKAVRDRVRGRRERVFFRWVNILCRLNGLLIGAISTEMVVDGVRDLWARP